MPLTKMDAANDYSTLSTADEERTDYREQIDKGFDTAYKDSVGRSDGELLKFMHKQVSVNYSGHAAHVSGYYYIQMVSGVWTDAVVSTQSDTEYFEDFQNNDMSSFPANKLNEFTKNFGMLATDIDIPQLNIEYETMSGRNRTLNYASRLNFSGDFSINFIENYTNTIFRYHESWFKYIDALKKGYVKSINKDLKITNKFIDIPYFNAVWVAIFAPFTTNIRGLVKIMGVSPINLPFKQIIGDRSKSTLTTINQNYKSNDMVYKFFDSDDDRNKSPLYKEFEKYMNDKVIKN